MSIFLKQQKAMIIDANNTVPLTSKSWNGRKKIIWVLFFQMCNIFWCRKMIVIERFVFKISQNKAEEDSSRFVVAFKRKYNWRRKRGKITINPDGCFFCS